MRRILPSLATALCLSLITPTLASETSKGDLLVSHPQARPNLPNRPTAAYMTISNSGETADALVSASSPAFGSIELHVTVKDGDVMKMQQIDELEVPAGETVALEPGGLHLMLFDSTKLHKAGDQFPLTLNFEEAGEMTVDVMVGKIEAADHGHHGHGSSGN